MVLLLFLFGLFLLVAGAEALVRGASRLSAAAGISPLVVGLTVVAFGTSAPELAVSVRSALGGAAGADIAIGNVVGSNIFNVLFILGLSAVIAPLVVSQQLVRVDVPILIAISGVTLVLAWDGSLGRWEGLTLFLGTVAYTVFAVAQGRREAAPVQEEYAKEFGSKPDGMGRVALNVAVVGIGLGMLVMGSRWLVDAATAMAQAVGVSELVIGLTVVAAGTSLPEVATSVIASVRGERDIAVGNVVGSNIFNLLAVLGLSALVAPAGVGVSASALRFDIPVMIAVSVACLPIFFTGRRISRWEGVLFLCYYAAYTSFLILEAGRHEAAEAFGAVMLWFVIPLTAVTLAVLVARQVRSR